MRWTTFQVVTKIAMLAGCSGVASGPAAPAPETTGTVLVRGGIVDGQLRDIALLDGRFAPPTGSYDDDEIIDVSGMYLVPGIIDSHVHLAYYPVGDELRRAGVAGAVDLAAPISFLQQPPALRLRASGPMLTSLGGYPTRSWGRDGYGIECGSADCVSASVDQIADAGATVLKLPMPDAGGMTRDLLEVAVRRASIHELTVAAHALSRADAMVAAEIGVDVLAHIPLEALSQTDAALWHGRAVISTMAAFGASSTAAQNLALLVQGGAIVLYGTDLGNERRVGISRDELMALSEAGLSATQVVAAATKSPADVFGFEDLGSFEPGNYGCVLVLARDPLADATALADVARVIGCDKPQYRSDSVRRYGQPKR